MKGGKDDLLKTKKRRVKTTSDTLSRNFLTQIRPLCFQPHTPWNPFTTTLSFFFPHSVSVRCRFFGTRFPLAFRFLCMYLRFGRRIRRLSADRCPVSFNPVRPVYSPRVAREIASRRACSIFPKLFLDDVLRTRQRIGSGHERALTRRRLPRAAAAAAAAA